MNRASQIRTKRRLTMLEVSHRTLAGAIEDALTHYWGAMKLASVGIPVAWDRTCEGMAQALESALQSEEEQAR